MKSASRLLLLQQVSRREKRRIFYLEGYSSAAPVAWALAGMVRAPHAEARAANWTDVAAIGPLAAVRTREMAAVFGCSHANHFC